MLDSKLVQNIFHQLRALNIAVAEQYCDLSEFQKGKKEPKKKQTRWHGVEFRKSGRTRHLDKVVYYPRPRPRRTTGVLGLPDLVRFGVIRVELRKVE